MIAGEIARRVERLGPDDLGGFIVVVIEQDDIDVRAGGEFAAPELAHADDSHAATRKITMCRPDLLHDGIELPLR